MKVRQNKFINDGEGLEMTPMIDVVFLLLIFFLLSAKFVAMEAQLQAFLPKEGEVPNVPPPPEATNVVLEFDWMEEQGGRVRCRTFDYRGADGQRKSIHEFGTTDGTQTYLYPVGAQGREARAVSFSSPDLPGYMVPDYSELEKYLAHRKSTYADPRNEGLPVTVNFTDQVPAQAVLLILDICDRIKIKNFRISAKELP
jgi:hypothetical protein